MKFVAIYGGYRHQVSAGTMRWVKDTSGSERQVDNGDSFWANFVLGGLDLHERELAIQEFRRLNGTHGHDGPIGFGAEPIMIDGTIDAGEASADGNTSNAHDGYQAWQRLSYFDTEDGRMCPARWKDITEETLLASSDFGRDFIRIDALLLAPPWPTYDEMAAEDIVPHALAGGYDLEAVLRYEKATQKRPAVGAPLKVALDRQRALRAEAAALTVNA